MSDIRFNQWLHNSGTGGVSQVDGGHVGIGTTNPLIPVGAGVTAILNVGVVTANSYYGDGSNLSGIVGGGTSLSFNDNIGAYFGNSQDLKIYHDGNHSYIDDQGTGNLRLRSGTLEILNLAGNKTSATFSSGGGQTLNFNNSPKFVTTNTGIDVTGSVVADDLIVTGTSVVADLKSTNNNYVLGLAGNNSSDKAYLGTDSSGNFLLATGSGVVERLRITSAGQTKLNISSNGALTEPLVIRNGGTGGGTNVGILFYNGNESSSGAGALARIKALDVGAYDSDLVFETGLKSGWSNSTTERLRIRSNGNVGINETSPDARLHISSPASTTCEIRLTANNTGSGSGDRGRINVYSSRNDGTEYQAGYVDIDRSSGTEDKAHLLVALNNGSGVGEKLRITSDGYVTKPAHPAFFVTMNGGDQTTAAANIMPFDTVVHNNGGHYKTSGSNIYHFVCPVAGYYFFGGQVWLKHGSGSGNHARWEIWRDTTVVALAGWHQNGVNLNDMQSSASVTIYCDAGAKVYMEADYAITYWRGNASQPHTFFHGHLIG